MQNIKKCIKKVKTIFTVIEGRESRGHDVAHPSA
jgi:hypothetical protein